IRPAGRYGRGPQIADSCPDEKSLSANRANGTRDHAFGRDVERRLGHSSGQYRSYAVGRQNSGKSTSPTTEPTEQPMHRATTLPVSEQTCSPEHCATLFLSLELSRSTWVATTVAPGSTKMSKHTLVGGDGRKLLDLLARLKTRAEQRISAPVKVVAIHEVGLDGFWIRRLLEANGVESHVVDPASIAVPRRHRRAKTDAIDGETLLL